MTDESTTTEEPRPPEPAQPDGDPRSTVLADVSTAMVGLYKEQFGRGPTTTRSHWAGPDALITVLEDTYTPAERNLHRMGEHERLRETRLFFQYATVREFCEPIERITGRTVRAFHSAIDTEAGGQAVEVFVFYPRGEEGPSRTERAEP